MWPIIAGMAIAAGSSIAGGLFGSASASAQKRAIRKAAKRAYNDNMEYARDYEKTLMDNMTDYERDAAEYRDTQFQRTMANGGMRADTYNRAALDEVKAYEFGIDQIDYEKYSKEKVADVYNPITGTYMKNKTEYQQAKADVKTDKKNTDLLKEGIDNYTGKQTDFQEKRENTALDIMQSSTQELQTDLNKTYVQGMQQVYYQRKQAYNNYQDMKTQADLYGLQSTLSLWSGLLGAGNAVGQGMVQMYGSSSGGSSGAGSNLNRAMNNTSPFTGYNYKYLGKGYQY